MPPPVLAVEAMGKVWSDGRRRIRVDVESLHLRAGEVRALVAPSGAGKSTALDMLALALRPDHVTGFRAAFEAGCGPVDITADAAAGRERTLAALRARGFAYVVQNSPLIPFLTARSEIALQQRVSGRIDAAFAEQAARSLGILECLDAYPSRLSVGQRQRVAVARAIACRPSVLLADEPTAALDPESARKVMGELIRSAESGTSILVVSHDRALVEEFGIPVVSVECGEDERGWSTRFRGGECAA